jgi:multiple sugar transport system substrate-binding protein
MEVAMRRQLRLFCLVATCSLLITACLGGGGGGGTAGPGASEGTIRYSLWEAAQLPAYQECAKAFHAKNPNIQVKIEQRAWEDYWNNLTTTMVAGNAPDVITDHLSKYPEFVRTHQILPIDDLIKRDSVPTNIYFPGLAELWKAADGHRYGLPKDWDTIAIFYNKKYARQAGVSEQQLRSMTWNPRDGGTFEKVIAHLTVDTKGVRGDEPGFDPKHVKVYGLGLENAGGTGFGQQQWSWLAASDGFKFTNKQVWGDRYFLDDPKLAETLTWWRSLIQKGYMPSLAAATSGAGFTETFGAGKYAMASNGSWTIKPYFDLKGVEIGLAPLPTGPIGKRASMFNGLADSIYAGTKKKEAAWQWVKFLASPECQRIVGQQGIVFPAIPEATAIAKQKFASKGVDVTAFTVNVDQHTTFTFPITDHASKITAILQPALDAIMSFKADPRKGLTDANKQVNALFAAG